MKLRNAQNTGFNEKQNESSFVKVMLFIRKIIPSVIVKRLGWRTRGKSAE